MAFLIPLASAAYGAIKSESAGAKRRNAEQTLEQQAKSFQPNASILDYYNKALAKYNPNPYQSETYQQSDKQVQRNLATGINASQNKRSGVGMIGGLVQGANDSSQKAVANAEVQGGADLSRLAQASSMKTQEQQKKFDMMYNLTAAKAGAYAQTQNTGISNMYSGLSNAAMMFDGQAKGLDAPTGTKRYNKAWDKKFGDIFY